jgi:hypothetical protein
MSHLARTLGASFKGLRGQGSGRTPIIVGASLGLALSRCATALSGAAGGASVELCYHRSGAEALDVDQVLGLALASLRSGTGKGPGCISRGPRSIPPVRPSSASAILRPVSGLALVQRSHGGVPVGFG